MSITRGLLDPSDWDMDESSSGGEGSYASASSFDVSVVEKVARMAVVDTGSGVGVSAKGLPRYRWRALVVGTSGQGRRR